MTPTPAQQTILRWREIGPALWAKEVFGVEPTWQQLEGGRAVAQTRRVSIRSGHGCGKSSFMAWCILWFLATRFPCKVPCTAPTGHQLSDILWAEISLWHRRLKERLPELGLEFDWSAEKFYLKSHPHESFAVARTSRKENPEALQGFHSENLLFLVDEASGVPEQVFQVGEGALSTEGAYVVMAANPTRESGYFYDSHHRMRSQWAALHWDGEKSPLVSKQYVDSMRAKYGVDSPIYKVRVKGDFAAAVDGVIPLELCTDAQVRDVAQSGDDEVWGVDVGRFGDDASALAKRRGNTMVEPVEVWFKRDTMHTAGVIKAAYDEARRKPKVIAIDVIGIGAGVVDRLIELELPVVGINVAESPSVSDKYARLRDELWFKGREWLETRAVKMRDDDEELVGELTTPKYSILSSGKLKVEGKDELKKRGVASPNRADAFLLTFANAASGKLRTKMPDPRELWSPADSGAGY